MKQLTKAIVSLINKQRKNGKTNLIRLESIDDPRILKGACKELSQSPQLQFIAKLTKEKYMYFKAEVDNGHRPDWESALNFLGFENDYIDESGAITKWRNQATEYTASGNNVLVLLMGTELAPDKGGLEDFFQVSPEELIDDLSKDYSKWFVDLFDNIGLPRKNINVMHAIFRNIFYERNVDLEKLSNYIDNLSHYSLTTVDDIVEYIFTELREQWGFPSIVARGIPRVSSMSAGTLKSAQIINDSYSFFCRSDEYLRKYSIAKVRKKLDKYAEALESEGVELQEQFTCGQSVFNSYDEFCEKLLDYLSGKNLSVLRPTFLNADYGIIDNIIHIATSVNSNTTINISGSPLEAYSKMIAKQIETHYASYKCAPEQVIISLDRLRLSNCSKSNDTDDFSDTVEYSFRNICTYLDGLLRFLNEGAISEGISIVYENEEDPFSLDFMDVNIHNVIVTEKWGDPCSIDFTLYCPDKPKGDALKFKWSFSPSSAWKNSFALLRNCFDEENGHFSIPNILTCDNIGEYLYCESEDEFFDKLDRIQTNVIDHATFNAHLKRFENTSLWPEYNILASVFQDWATDLVDHGVLHSLEKMRITIVKYEQLMNNILTELPKLSGVQNQYLYLLLDLFLITGNNKILSSMELKECIVPVYHPLMLEKIDSQLVFMRHGFCETIKSIISGNNQSVSAGERIDNYSQLCEITQGPDALLSKNSKYLSCSTVWSCWGIYFDSQTSESIISNDIISNLITDEDSDDAASKSTPEARIIERNVKDYLETFPARYDGINVCFVDPPCMQHIVAAVRAVTKSIEKAHRTTVINITLICLDQKKNSASYLRQWLDDYFGDENTVRVNTFLKYATSSSLNKKGVWEDLLCGQDLCFLYNILEPCDVKFQKAMTDVELNDMETTRFPMTFEPDTITKEHGTARIINVSQLQFQASKAHAQAIHKVGHPYDTDGLYRTMRVLEMKEIKHMIVDVAHDVCHWVVCVDKAVDRDILQAANKKIIGFTTGEGQYGELNVTVSAKDTILVDIKNLLKRRIKDRFTKWSDLRLQQAANFCVDIATNLDGSRMLKALNPYDYEIHNYLAYVLTLQALKINEPNDKFIIRQLINLDNHMHWFDNSYDSENGQASKYRPDFMLIEVEHNPENLDENKVLKIRLKLVECKMGFETEAKVNHAQEQIARGISCLSSYWYPTNRSITYRYWFHQLYRALIFSPLNINENDSNFEIIRDKLHHILDGRFEIEWSGDIYAYWLDNDGAGEQQEILPLSNDSATAISEITYHFGGQQYIQKMLLPVESRNQTFEYENIEVYEGEITDLDDIVIKEEEIIDSKKNGNKEIVSKFEITNNGGPEVNVETHDASDLTQITQNNPITEDNVGVGGDDKTGNVSGKIEGKKGNSGESYDINTKKPLSNVRILIGSDLKLTENYFWEFGNKELNNRHLLINGNSGCGKTYCIQAMLMELVLQDVSAIVFDYTGGFANSKLDPLFKSSLGKKVVQRIIKRDAIPINPFVRHETQIDEDMFIPETNTDIASRIANIFTTVYKFGSQQKSAIYAAIYDKVKTYGDNMTFVAMAEALEEQDSSYSKTVLSKIRPFLDIDPFNSNELFSWKDIRDGESVVYVMQLAGYDRDTQMLLTELMLWDIWGFCEKNGDESKPIVLVMDEAQNLSHAIDSPSAKILTEGRKFGISGWYATQFMKPQLSDDEIQRLQQAGQKLYFCPPDDGVMTVAKNIDINNQNAKDWAEKLKKLKKGECVTCGSMVRHEKWMKYEPRAIKVTSLQERLNNVEKK